MTNAFAFNGILLSDKFQGGEAQAWKGVIIQRCVRGIVNNTAYVKIGVLKFEGLGAHVRRAGVAIFRWS